MKYVKRRDIDDDREIKSEIESKVNEITAELADKKECKVKTDILKLVINIQEEATKVDDVNIIRSNVQTLKDEIIRTEALKWYAAIYGFIFTFFLFFFCIYPLFYYCVAGVAKNDVLKAAIINENMIPKNL